MNTYVWQEQGECVPGEDERAKGLLQERKVGVCYCSYIVLGGEDEQESTGTALITAHKTLAASTSITTPLYISSRSFRLQEVHSESPPVRVEEPHPSSLEVLFRGSSPSSRYSVAAPRS